MKSHAIEKTCSKCGAIHKGYLVGDVHIKDQVMITCIASDNGALCRSTLLLSDKDRVHKDSSSIVDEFISKHSSSRKITRGIALLHLFGHHWYAGIFSAMSTKHIEFMIEFIEDNEGLDHLSFYSRLVDTIRELTREDRKWLNVFTVLSLVNDQKRLALEGQ